MILENICRERQPLHDAITHQINRFLDAGKLIEILGPGDGSNKAIHFHGDYRSNQERRDGMA